MFEVEAPATFPATVYLSVPGKALRQPVQVTFRHKSQSEARDWVAANEPTLRDRIFGKKRTAADVLHEVIADMELSRKGQTIVYSKDELYSLINNFWPAQEELTEAYLRELRESRTKNS